MGSVVGSAVGAVVLSVLLLPPQAQRLKHIASASINARIFFIFVPSFFNN
jgi:hypothetical protein